VASSTSAIPGSRDNAVHIDAWTIPNTDHPAKSNTQRDAGHRARSNIMGIALVQSVASPKVHPVATKRSPTGTKRTWVGRMDVRA